MPLLIEWGKEIDTFLWMCSRNYVFDVIIIIAFTIIILIINNVFVVVMLQNRQVMVTSFRCCSYSGGPLRASIVGVPATSGKDGCGGNGGDSDIVMEDVCEVGIRNLGGRMVSMLMRAGILLGGLVVVVVGVMVVMAVGVVSFSEERCLSVKEVEC